ncbi:MAG: hypothetical protein CSA39_01285 [Flavobacteriales bacterium]|nr:MAG: hypothetical protein CSA39_01285 [Flavobacteriales bacterium]
MKKLLAPIDINNVEKKVQGFLYPNINTHKINNFINVKDCTKWDYGMVVYVGRDVTIEDFFTKIVDSGVRISSVKKTTKLLKRYFNVLKEIKIGTIVRVTHDDENDFIFEKVKVS